MQQVALGEIAVGAQLVERLGRLRRQRGAREQSRLVQRDAAVRGIGGRQEGGGGSDRGARVHAGAGLVQVGVGEIVEERTAEHRKGLRALLDRQPRVGGRVHVRLADRDAVDEVVLILLGGRQSGAAAVGGARCDDQGVPPIEHDALATLRRGRPELLVQPVERVDDGLQRVAAPVLLGILLRMRVLVRDPVGRGGIEGRTLRVGEVGREQDWFPATVASVNRPSTRLTRFACRSCRPLPVPLSVYATAQPCFITDRRRR